MDAKSEEYKQFEIKEGIVFLIELSPAILEPLAELQGQPQLLEILRCINDLVSDMVVTFPSNGVGIYFYNSSTTGSKFAKNSGINKLFSLNDLNSSNMKRLNETVRDHLDGFEPLNKKFHVADAFKDNLHTVLRTILREFQFKPQYNVKKLFWFTNNDKPYVNPELKDSLRTMVGDFEDNKIFISPFFLDTFSDDGQSQRKSFDTTLFQNIFLNTNFLESEDASGEVFAPSQSQSRWSKTTVTSQIRDSIFRLKEVRRVQFSCDLILGDGPSVGGDFGCSVRGYTLYNHEKIRHFKQVSTAGDQLKIVHHDSKSIRSDTNEAIEFKEGVTPPTLVRGIPVKRTNEETDDKEKLLLLWPKVTDFLRSYSFDHCPKETEELEVIDSDGEEPEVQFSNAPYLKLLCFRDWLDFKPYLNLKPPLFVTADFSNGLSSSSKEGGYTNSFKTFRSLYQSCLKKKKYAVVFGCIKKNSSPDLYALFPTNSGGQKPKESNALPDGFLLMNICWLNEIRSLPDYMLAPGNPYFQDEQKSESPELKNLYRKMIEHVQPWDTFTPSQFPNPVLDYFYKVIKHEALQMDIKDEDADLAKQDWSVGKLIELRETIMRDPDLQSSLQFASDIMNKMGNSETVKRISESQNSPAKRPKVEPLVEAAVITMWKNNTWGNVTVAQLREFIQRYDKIKMATRKADMIENISQFLESRKK